MGGRTRLSSVTALTVAGLLLGGGAMNALADDPGGGRGGDRRDRQVQQQQVQQPEGQQEHRGGGNTGAGTNGGGNNGDRGNSGVSQHQPDAVVAPPNDAQRDRDRGPDVKEAEVENQDEDLVSPPVRVTEEVRPGFGCGDANHEHAGPPGNPDLASPCKLDDNDHGRHGLVEDEGDDD